MFGMVKRNPNKLSRKQVREKQELESETKFHKKTLKKEDEEKDEIFKKLQDMSLEQERLLDYINKGFFTTCVEIAISNQWNSAAKELQKAEDYPTSYDDWKRKTRDFSAKALYLVEQDIKRVKNSFSYLEKQVAKSQRSLGQLNNRLRSYNSNLY